MKIYICSQRWRRSGRKKGGEDWDALDLPKKKFDCFSKFHPDSIKQNFTLEIAKFEGCVYCQTRGASHKVALPFK
jgi:hypothetical protein